MQVKLKKIIGKNMEKVKKGDLIERILREVEGIGEDECLSMVREGKGVVFLTRDGDKTSLRVVCSGASLFAMLLHLYESGRVPDMFWDTIAAMVMSDETRARHVMRLGMGGLSEVLEFLRDVIERGEDRNILPTDNAFLSVVGGKIKS